LRARVRWVKRYETTGEISPALLAAIAASAASRRIATIFLGLIRRTPDITLLEIRSALSPIAASVSARPLQDDHARRQHPSFRPDRDQGFRPADQRRLVRGLGGAMPCSHALASDIVVMDNLLSHKGQRRATHKSRRSRTAISAALQPGHEPDRKGLFQAESLLAQNRRANGRRLDESARNLRRHLQTRRM